MRIGRWVGLGLLATVACTPAPRSSPAPAAGVDAEFAAAREAVRRQTAADVLPLLPLRPDSNRMVRVVTLTDWDGYARALDAGNPRIVLEREVWVTPAGEVRDSCATFPRGRVVPEVARLLGLLPGDTLNQSFVELAAPLDSIFRPAPDRDPTAALPCPGSEVVQACGVDSLPESHPMRGFLTRQRASEYPFTGLGYTYNWRRGAPRYGASEYVVPKGTSVRVIAVTGPEAYCAGSG